MDTLITVVAIWGAVDVVIAAAIALPSVRRRRAAKAARGRVLVMPDGASTSFADLWSVPTANR